MKKTLVSLLIALSAGTAAMAQSQDVDNRPARQKAQDVYIEPTLRVKSTTTTIVVDPVTSERKVIEQKESTKVYDHGGQVIQSDEQVQQVTQPVVNPQVATPTTTATPAVKTAPVQQKVIKKEITDMSRPKP